MFDYLSIINYKKTRLQGHTVILFQVFKGISICDNLEGRDGMGDGKEVQEGGDICIPVADSY